MPPRERIVVIGSGGREHALAWRLARDPECEALWVAPGNDASAARWPRLDVRESDVAGMISSCAAVRATLVVVGPEGPLAAGVVDALEQAGIAAYGPRAAAAQLEASKWFAKTVMAEAVVPTARAERVTDRTAAFAALARFDPPWVLKADGLAAGKGVCVTSERGEAEEFLRACLDGARFGESGRIVVIEEHLDGEEASLMAVCDGERFVTLPSARDYKRAFDGDRGPNTGGMGAYCPTPAVDPALEAEVGERVIAPVLRVLAARGTPFRGTLYVGLMIASGKPYVLEFNARFGDPETEVVLPMVEGSLVRLLAGVARGALDATAISRARGACVALALVDQGYPDTVKAGGVITGLDALERDPDLHVFHAGSRRHAEGWQVSGGRAAYVTAHGATVEAARARALAAIATLGGRGWRFRSDIAAPRVGAVVR